LSAVSTSSRIPLPRGELDGATGADSNSPDMRYLVRALVKYNASDLHIKGNRPPLFRINGKLIPAKMPAMSEEQAQRIIYAVLSSRQRAELEDKRQVDLSFQVADLGRFRCKPNYQ
jgi:twitching motility protein PilT